MDRLKPAPTLAGRGDGRKTTAGRQRRDDNGSDNGDGGKATAGRHGRDDDGGSWARGKTKSGPAEAGPYNREVTAGRQRQDGNGGKTTAGVTGTAGVTRRNGD